MQVHYPTVLAGKSLLPNVQSEVSSATPIDCQPHTLKDQSALEKKRRALVVDDVADVTEMLAVLLTHAGYEVITASSAASAISSAQQDQFDVIISDIGMPQMNGYELARELRGMPNYESVPMVALTGYSKFDDRQRSLDAGFNAHLTKPIEPRELLDLIEQL
jgi:two-component system, chemotaxis family, CheB/CheR fusion protein